jgi:hypothetical protein
MLLLRYRVWCFDKEGSATVARAQEMGNPATSLPHQSCNDKKVQIAWKDSNESHRTLGGMVNPATRNSSRGIQKIVAKVRSKKPPLSKSKAKKTLQRIYLPSIA